MLPALLFALFVLMGCFSGATSSPAAPTLAGAPASAQPARAAFASAPAPTGLRDTRSPDPLAKGPAQPRAAFASAPGPVPTGLRDPRNGSPEPRAHLASESDASSGGPAPRPGHQLRPAAASGADEAGMQALKVIITRSRLVICFLTAADDDLLAVASVAGEAGMKALKAGASGLGILPLRVKAPPFTSNGSRVPAHE